MGRGESQAPLGFDQVLGRGRRQHSATQRALSAGEPAIVEFNVLVGVIVEAALQRVEKVVVIDELIDKGGRVYNSAGQPLDSRLRECQALVEFADTAEWPAWTRRPQLGRTGQALRAGISGDPLLEALEQHERLFVVYWVPLWVTVERSGSLEVSKVEMRTDRMQPTGEVFDQQTDSRLSQPVAELAIRIAESVCWPREQFGW